jgi:chromosome segregation protein
LRDVVDLCRDTGLGANAYAIIENRMIDAILSDRADERRGLFEEAAGIGKYKDRRKAALRRLERAEMDLQRLEDVIGEVQTKVRSLARQKGKAQRYTEYRQRRLDVEVAVVRHQLDMLRERLAMVDKELAGDIRSGEGVVAELATAEAEFEALRLRQVDAERNRSQAAKELDGVREHLVRWERELAVADERGAYAERRLAQIDEERGQTRERAERLHQEQAALERDRGGLAEELAGLKGVADERAEEVASVRARLLEAREALEAIEARARDLARRGAQLEGDAEASEAQAEELGRRIEQVDAELASASETLTDLESQGDLFSGRVEDLADTVGSSRAAMEAAETAVAEGRARFEAARAEEREAAAEAAALSARRSALERLQEGLEGVQPVVKAALGLGDDGVLAPLSDYIEADAETMRAAEAYLGTLATALVVRDSETLERIVGWFRGEWSGGGGLIALPLDRVPTTAAASGGLLARLTITGAGAPWVRALLDGVEVSGPALAGVPVTERGGVVRIGDPGGGSGVLERKEELRGLAVAHEGAVLREEQAREALALAEGTLAVAESAHADARVRFRTVEDDHRRVASELAAQADHRGRVDRMRGDLARQLEGTRAARARAGERARAAREDRAALLLQESGIQEERDHARSAVETVQEEWETARAEEARLAVDVARLEGDVARYSERLVATTDALEQALGRVAALASEESGLRDALEEARRTRTEGDEATERLFAERTRAEAEVQARDEVLQEVAQALSQAERRVREARTAERASVDHRHALELEQAGPSTACSSRPRPSKATPKCSRSS